MTAARLVLDHVGKWHDGMPRPALSDVSLDVAPGTILVLLGTSGAGKTTLLRIVAGLEDATSGAVVLGERTLSAPRVVVPPERRGVGLVFQHLELWPHMCVAANIAFGLAGRPSGRRAQRDPQVQAIADAVGVSHLLDRSPGTLSGGERQRVAIARTLAPSPDVVLYDEPLANLDPERRADLRRLIRRLCRDLGTTLVYVTHGAEEAMEMGDQIAVLHAGRVVDRGTPDDLYARPTSLAGARALGTVSAIPARVAADGIDSVLGRLEPTEPVAAGSAWALLRPEAVRTPGPVAGRVLEVRPLGGTWAFRAEVEGHVVEGRSPAALEVGASVGLSVHGPVAVVPVEEEVACDA